MLFQNGHDGVHTVLALVVSKFYVADLSLGVPEYAEELFVILECKDGAWAI